MQVQESEGDKNAESHSHTLPRVLRGGNLGLEAGDSF